MISTVYNYYMSTYANHAVSRYDTHKKSELRSVYNHMLNVNKKTPLYKINYSDEVQKFAIDLKENAHTLKNIAESLSEDSEHGTAFLKKTAFSSDEEIVFAKCTDGAYAQSSEEQLNIEVRKLAGSQINTGIFVDPMERGLDEGSYSLDILIGDFAYELHFNVSMPNTNLDIQQSIERMVNRSNLGIEANITENEDGETALQLSSDSTGASEFHPLIFSISDDNSSKKKGAVQFLGLDHVSSYPSNALFTINGEEKSSQTNHYNYDSKFALDFKKTTLAGESVTVGYKPDIDSIVDNIHDLVNGYNSMIDLANSKASVQTKNHSLFSDVGSIASSYKNELEATGLNVLDNGKIQVDDHLLIQSADEGTLKENFSHLDDFKDALLSKADSITINPMAYIEKLLVAYKNPLKTFNAPYVTSIYSGMMFNMGV